METPRPTSSVYSRDRDGNPISLPESASLYTTARPSAAESAINSLLQDQMSLLTPRAERKIRAIASISNRLLFEDGFQLEIIQAMRLVHVELRVTLAQGVTAKTAKNIEHLTATLDAILARWTRKNQAFSEELVSCDFKNPPCTSEEALAFKAKILRLPTINGCELNLAAVHRLHIYFVDCVASPFHLTRASMHHLPHIAAAAQSIQSCFHMMQDRFEDAAFSAEQLGRDTVKAWQHVSQLRAEIEAEEDKRQQEEKEDKSSRSKRPFKSFISKFRGHAKKNSEDATKNNEDDLKPDFCSQRLSLGLSEAGKRPRLALLPSASLQLLEQQQKDIQRHHDNFHCQSQRSRPDTIRIVSNSSQPEMARSETRHDSFPVLQDPRRPVASQPEHEQMIRPDIIGKENSQESHDSDENDNEGITNRERIIDQRFEDDAEMEELTQLEQEILDASIPDHLSQPDSSEDPEAAKTWWRKRALQDLEAGLISDEEEQSGESAGEEEDQEDELTEEEHAKRREQAKAKALALLEGKDGPDADAIQYDFSRLSFNPDEMECLGRPL